MAVAIVWWHVAVAILIPLGGSFAIQAATDPPGDWYRSLNKPSWTPPNWLFPVMWTTLYVLMGIASWLVWQQGGFEAQQLALGLYAAQLVLNFAWTPLFFGLKRTDWALGVIVVMWVAIAATIVAFWAVNTTAAYLLIPYIGWVSVATALNYYIYVHNPAYRTGLSEPLTY